jgi:regulator of cell morphogenesis and NO signaling
LRGFNIDFVVDSDDTLQQVCAGKGLDLSAVQDALTTAIRNIQLSNSLPFHEWKVDFLIDYIINVHHEYIRRKMPLLSSSIEDICKSDTSCEADAKKLKEIFNGVRDYLLPHMNEEEISVFPYLKQVTSAWYKKETYGSLLVRTLRKPVEKTLLQDHDKLKYLMQQLRIFTSHYASSPSTSIRYKVLLSQLHEFDNDLVQHMYLENQVLFPKVMSIEKELLSANISA